VFRVVQLVATTVVMFAVIHYYVALLSTKPAYSIGLTVPEPHGGWEYYQTWVDRLMFWPPFESVLDCFYFADSVDEGGGDQARVDDQRGENFVEKRPTVTL
jgi:hypothetical protein